MFVNKINDSCFVFDMDMILTKDQVEELETNNMLFSETAQGQTKGAMIRSGFWPNKTVYYTYAPNVDQSFIIEIEAAIQAWREQTQLRFKKRTKETNYVRFILGNDGSYSKVGCIGGRQDIYLDRRWADRGTAMHEIGHAVGMIHEHQCWFFHDNVNSILKFKWDNIRPAAKSNYTKYSRAHDGFSHGSDFNWPINSLMIYGSYSDFGIDQSKPVMTVARGSFESTFRAQRSYLSISDRLAVARKYGYNYDPNRDPNLPPI